MPTAAEKWPHLYNTRRWRRARRVFLTESPNCTMCRDHGIIAPAIEVDHIKPHRGDSVLFWDVDNWQGLCPFHHRSIKSRIERNGGDYGFDVDGNPLDDRHHWKI